LLSADDDDTMAKSKKFVLETPNMFSEGLFCVFTVTQITTKTRRLTVMESRNLSREGRVRWRVYVYYSSRPLCWITNSGVLRLTPRLETFDTSFVMPFDIKLHSSVAMPDMRLLAPYVSIFIVPTIFIGLHWHLHSFQNKARAAAKASWWSPPITLCRISYGHLSLCTLWYASTTCFRLFMHLVLLQVAI